MIRKRYITTLVLVAIFLIPLMRSTLLHSGDKENSDMDEAVLFSIKAIRSQNCSEAIKWYTQAAERGHSNSQYTLGYMYEKGECVSLDYTKALHYYGLAAKQDNPFAKYQIAFMHSEGRGVQQNNKRAFILYKEAAELDYVKAQYALGVMYRNGLGIDQNNILAQKWFIIAYERYRDAEAFREKNELLKIMTQDQVAEAQKLATDWIKTKSPTQCQIMD